MLHNNKKDVSLLKLSEEDMEIFMGVLNNPPEANAKLKAARLRHDEFIEQNNIQDERQKNTKGS